VWATGLGHRARAGVRRMRRHDGTRRFANDSLGDAAHNQVRETAAAVRAHHNQIDVVRACDFGDHLRHRAHLRVDRNAETFSLRIREGRRQPLP
jgi:hypothetical protein